jgi:hypothetical protein
MVELPLRFIHVTAIATATRAALLLCSGKHERPQVDTSNAYLYKQHKQSGATRHSPMMNHRVPQPRFYGKPQSCILAQR